MVDAVAAGTSALRSNKISSVSALMTTPLKLARRASATRVATEQVRAMLEVGEALGELDVEALCDADGSLVNFEAVPEMLKPPMISARVAIPEAAPIATCLKYANFSLPSDKTCP
jgi:hypothetical protein